MSSLFASRHEFWCGRARYWLGYAWQAEHLVGRRLSVSAAERVLAGLLRSSDEHSVRNAYRGFAEAFDLSRISNDEVLRWFSVALGAERGRTGLPSLVLVELDSPYPVVSAAGIHPAAGRRWAARSTLHGGRHSRPVSSRSSASLGR